MLRKVLECREHVIIIDDAHHLNAPSWALLVKLLQMRLPLAVILAARSHAFRYEGEDVLFIPLEVRKRGETLMVQGKRRGRGGQRWRSRL